MATYEQKQVMKALRNLLKIEEQEGNQDRSEARLLIYHTQTVLALLADHLKCPRAEIEPLIGEHLADIVWMSDKGGV